MQKQCYRGHLVTTCLDLNFTMLATTGRVIRSRARNHDALETEKSGAGEIATAGLKQTFDLPVLIDANCVRGGNSGKSRHGHDRATNDDDEFRTRCKTNLSNRYDVS